MSFRRAIITGISLLIAVSWAQAPAWGQESDRFTIVVLPDTQNYSEDETLAPIFLRQTEWIVDQRTARSIVFVGHEGDLVQRASVGAEWERARAAMDRLYAANVPHGFCAGNHDDGSDSLMGVYFGAERFQSFSWWGGSYMPAGGFNNYNTSNGSNYQRFLAGGYRYLVVHLERLVSMEDLASATTLEDESSDTNWARILKARLRWVDGILKQHADHHAIVITHEFLRLTGDRALGGDFIFEKLIAQNPNVFLVMNGHELGSQAEAHRTDFVGSRAVHQLLANYQSRSRGGNGWLRLLEFSPGERLIRVKTYSPYLDAFETDANSQFELWFDPTGVAPAPPAPRAPSNVRVIGEN